MKYQSLDLLFQDLPEHFKPAVAKLRLLFLQHDGVKEMVQWNAFVYKWGKKNRAYINVYKKKKCFYLGFGQGAAMVKSNPVLHYAFDEVKEVVAKVEISSIDDIDKKSLAELIQLAIQFRK